MPKDHEFQSQRDLIMKQHLLNATLGTLLTSTLALSAAADGPETVWGSATITIQNGQTVITASDGTVLDWQSLMVAPWETLEFNLPDGESAILNRVLGGTPTDIQGSLLSNGQVYIVNPAGVVFGADAVVDCGGLYAVAGNMSLDDWMQGIDRFELTGEVTNHGNLQGNKVALLGQRVLNHGTVQAGNGLIALVAGDEVLLWESGGRLHAKIDGELLANAAGTGQAASDLSGLAAVENTGSIQGGSVLFGAGDAFALALNNQGLVQANTAEFSAVGGGVVLGGMIEGQTIEANGPVLVLDGAISSTGGLVSLDASEFLQLASGSSVDVSNQGGAAGAFMASSTGSLVIAPDAQINASGDVGGLVDLSGDSAFFGGDIDVDGEHMDGLLVLGGGVLGADILIVEDIPNDDVNNISFDFNGSVGLDNPGLITGTNYLVANALTQFFGPIRIHTSGDIEVLAELDFSDSFVPELRLHAGQQLTVNAAININGDLVLIAGGSPSVDEGGQFGLIEINAGLNALGDILIDGVAEGNDPSNGLPYQNVIFINTSELISAGEELRFSDEARLFTDANLAGNVVFEQSIFDGNTSGLGGLFGIAVDGNLELGGDAGGIAPNQRLRSLDITGDLTLAAGKTIRVEEFIAADSLTAGADSGIQIAVLPNESGSMTLGGDLIAEGDLTLAGNFAADTENVIIGGNLTTSSSVGMSLNVNGDVMVDGNLNALSDLNINAAGQMEVVQNVNAEFADLDLTADRLRFGGSVVKAASLRLTALGGGDESPVLFLNENGVQLLIGGDFNLNSNAPAGVAGLGAFGNLSLNAENIDLGESTITALGDLTLSANGTLTVKDLNALGDLILQGSELIIELEDGRTVDMICGGDFVVDAAAVTTVGDGTFRFAPTTGIELSNAFLQSVSSDFQIGQPNGNFNASGLGAGSQRLLDASSVELPAQLLPPDEEQLAAQTARAERELGMAENQAFQDAFDISVQSNALGELGRRLGLVSLDASNVGGGDNRPIISELRLRPSAARAAVAAHQELMASGSARVLQAAWERFTAGRESIDPAVFRVWLSEADEVLASQGWAAHDRMRAALRLSGLTPSEARAAVQAANANLGVAEVSEALQTILGGVKAEAATASANVDSEAPAA